jgi:hypothetical protein
MNDIEKALDVLNTAYEANPNAIRLLMCNRVEANQALLDHPVIPVNQLQDFKYADAFSLVNGVVFAITGKMVRPKWTIVPKGEVSTLLGFEVEDKNVPSMPDKYRFSEKESL